MHGLASFNCQALPSSEPTIAALASGAIYGKGVFTTIAVFDSIPFLWDKHWRRLQANAAYLAIDLSGFEEGVISRALEEILGANKVSSARARITFFDERSSELWPSCSKRTTSLLITTADLNPPSDNVALTVSPHSINSTSPLASVKSCNYLEKILAKDDAKSRGFDEAIQLNERGEVTSACMANVFWMKSGKLFTPSLGTGCLPGTTREFVIENLECEKVLNGIDELCSSDEIFLTSAGLGVAKVAEFEGRQLDRSPHPIMSLIPRADP